ncbi:hypothetical protein HDU96_003186 [Phlyctochytrium bullatum]|nr:hypothetical protein HDU96_003186 [Phlyctochytrium bullatum]
MSVAMGIREIQGSASVAKEESPRKEDSKEEPGLENHNNPDDANPDALLARLKEAPSKERLVLLKKIMELDDAEVLQKAVESIEFNILQIPDLSALGRKPSWPSLSPIIVSKALASKPDPDPHKLRHLWLMTRGTEFEGSIAADVALRKLDYRMKFVDAWIKSKCWIPESLTALAEKILNELELDLAERTKSVSWAWPKASFNDNDVIKNFLRSKRANDGLQTKEEIRDGQAVVTITKDMKKFQKPVERIQTVRKALEDIEKYASAKRKREANANEDGKSPKALKAYLQHLIVEDVKGKRLPQSTFTLHTKTELGYEAMYEQEYLRSPLPQEALSLTEMAAEVKAGYTSMDIGAQEEEVDLRSKYDKVGAGTYGDDDGEVAFDTGFQSPSPANNHPFEEAETFVKLDIRGCDERVEEHPELEFLSNLLSAPSLEERIKETVAVPFDGEAPELPSAPAIHVEGLGILTLPLMDATAKQLASVCEQPPPCNAEVDVIGGSSFELSPERFSITNKDWQDGLNELMRIISESLGCGNVCLSAKVRKMVLHQPGSVGERARKHLDACDDDDGLMVATLVVQLPSSYKGGQLVLQYDDETESVFSVGSLKSSKSSCMNHCIVHAAAAEHRIANITEGYCLVLVYSVHLPRIVEDVPISTEQIKMLIDQELEALQTPFWLPLKHIYDEDSIVKQGIQVLQGIDRSRAALLDHSSVQLYLVHLFRQFHYDAVDGKPSKLKWEEGPYVRKWRDILGCWVGKRRCPKVSLTMINPDGLTLAEAWGTGRSRHYLCNDSFHPEPAIDKTFETHALMVVPLPAGSSDEAKQNQERMRMLASMEDKDPAAYLALLRDAESVPLPANPSDIARLDAVKLNTFRRLLALPDSNVMQEAVNIIDFRCLASSDIIALSKKSSWPSISTTVVEKTLASTPKPENLATIWLLAVQSPLEDVIACDLSRRRPDLKTGIFSECRKQFDTMPTTIPQKLEAMVGETLEQVTNSLLELESRTWEIHEAVYTDDADVQNFLRSDEKDLVYEVKHLTNLADICRKLRNFHDSSNRDIRIVVKRFDEDVEEERKAVQVGGGGTPRGTLSEGVDLNRFMVTEVEAGSANDADFMEIAEREEESFLRVKAEEVDSETDGDDDGEASSLKEFQAPSQAKNHSSMESHTSVTKLDISGCDEKVKEPSELKFLSRLLSASPLEERIKETVAVPFDGEALELPSAPAIHVEGLGILSLPLIDATAKQLASVCEQPPPYNGEVDVSNGSSLELSAGKFSITNTDWQNGLDELMGIISESLGCGEVRLFAKLRKMVLHQPSPASSCTRFREHLDNDDDALMVATLVVQLPSFYKGGQLVLQYGDGTENVFGLGTLKSAKSPCMNHCTVHAAAAEHRIADITEGYCLVLVYSVYLPRIDENIPVSTEQKRILIDKELKTLKTTFWLPLKHVYDNKSFLQEGIEVLKGIDQGRAALLDHPSVERYIVQLFRQFRYEAVNGNASRLKWEEGPYVSKWLDIAGGSVSKKRTPKVLLTMINPDGLTVAEAWGIGRSHHYLCRDGFDPEPVIDKTFEPFALMIVPLSTTDSGGVKSQEWLRKLAKMKGEDPAAYLSLLQDTISHSSPKNPSDRSRICAIKRSTFRRILACPDLNVIQEAVSIMDFECLETCDILALSKKPYWGSVSTVVVEKLLATTSNPAKLATLWQVTVGTPLEDVIARDLSRRNLDLKSDIIYSWRKRFDKTPATIPRKLEAIARETLEQLNSDLLELKKPRSWKFRKAKFTDSAEIQNFLRSEEETLIHRVNRFTNARELCQKLRDFHDSSNRDIRIAAKRYEEDGQTFVRITKRLASRNSNARGRRREQIKDLRDALLSIEKWRDERGE